MPEGIQKEAAQQPLFGQAFGGFKPKEAGLFSSDTSSMYPVALKGEEKKASEVD